MDRRRLLGSGLAAMAVAVLPRRQLGGDLRVVFEGIGPAQTITATLDGKPLPLSHIEIEYINNGLHLKA